MNLIEKYFERDFALLPTLGKRPFTTDWVRHDFSNDIGLFKNKNIGLKTGKVSGLIVIDIDTPDKTLQKKIQSLLPPILCGKRGNPNRAPNQFFKYNGERAEKIQGVVELLSDGNQTIIPPSIHPDLNIPYEWVGKSILDVDIDDYPDLPENFMNDVRGLVDTGAVKANAVQPSDGVKCGSGSHNKLSDILVACIHDGKLPHEIVDELLAYDEIINPVVSYFKCPGRKEWRNLEARVSNVYKFVMQGFERHIKTGDVEDVPTVNHVLTINEYAEEEKEIFVRKKLPHFRGIGAEMFNYIYSQSHVPRSQLSFASVMALTSIILANRIQLEGILPNLYILTLCPSGFGKDAPLEFPKDALFSAGYSELIGEGAPSSDTGIMMNLPHQRERLDVVDEADSLFSALNGSQSYSRKMADVYATLYSRAGKFYQGKNVGNRQGKDNKMGNIGACHSPYVSLIGAMTLKAFRESFKTITIEKGLGARFLYFAESNKKRPVRFTKKDLPESIVDFMKMWRDSTETTFLDLTDSDMPMYIPKAMIDNKADQLLNKYRDLIEDQKELLDVDNKFYSILNRSYENMVKLTIIDSCLVNPKTTKITIEKESVEWAFKVIMTHNDNMKEFIEENVSENINDSNINRLLRVLDGHSKGMSKTDFGNKTRFLPRVQKLQLITDMLENRLIYAIKVEGEGIKKTTKFIHNKYTHGYSE